MGHRGIKGSRGIWIHDGPSVLDGKNHVVTLVLYVVIDALLTRINIIFENTVVIVDKISKTTKNLIIYIQSM